MPFPTGEAYPRGTPIGINYFDVSVEVPQGWLSINDGVIYRVHAESFASGGATQFRRQRVQSPFVAGQFTVNAVEDIVEENVTVYVTGYDYVDLQDNVDNLIEAFSQFSYQMRVDTDSSRKIWNCDQADYSVSYDQVGLHNRLLIARFTVPRQPTVQREIISDG